MLYFDTFVNSAPACSSPMPHPISPHICACLLIWADLGSAFLLPPCSQQPMTSGVKYKTFGTDSYYVEYSLAFIVAEQYSAGRIIRCSVSYHLWCCRYRHLSIDPGTGIRARPSLCCLCKSQATGRGELLFLFFVMSSSLLRIHIPHNASCTDKRLRRGFRNFVDMAFYLIGHLAKCWNKKKERRVKRETAIAAAQ